MEYCFQYMAYVGTTSSWLRIAYGKEKGRRLVRSFVPIYSFTFVRVMHSTLCTFRTPMVYSTKKSAIAQYNFSGKGFGMELQMS